MKQSKVYSGFLFNKEVRFYLTDATDMVQEINEVRKYSATALAALGRTSMITGIMGLMIKEENGKITSVINGKGSIGTIIVTANSKGQVKGRVTNPLEDVPEKYPGKLDVSKLVGKNGTIRITKDLGLKEPFTSEVELVSGEIAKDFTYYFSTSEQIPTAVAAGVLINPDYSIKNASAFIVQILPNANPDTITKLEDFFNQLTSISDILQKITPLQFLNENFKNDYKILKEEELEFCCECSKEKFIEGLRLLADSEKEEIKNDEQIECICDFCNKKYDINTKEI